MKRIHRTLIAAGASTLAIALCSFCCVLTLALSVFVSQLPDEKLNVVVRQADNICASSAEGEGTGGNIYVITHYCSQPVNSAEDVRTRMRTNNYLDYVELPRCSVVDWTRKYLNSSQQLTVRPKPLCHLINDFGEGTEELNFVVQPNGEITQPYWIE